MTLVIKPEELDRKRKTDEIAFEEKMLTERKKFKAEMKKILVADDRVNKSLTLDRDFNNVIKKELEARRDMRLQKGLNKQ